MADQAAQGKKLLAESKYLEAVDQFSLALKASPTSPDYLVQRSIAYQRSKQYAEALKDAEAAVVYANKRAKRELIVQGQLRRGIALFNLERYGDAKFVLDVVKRMDAKEKSVAMWLNKTATKLAAEAGKDDSKTQITVKETPDLELADEITPKADGRVPTTVAGPQATPADKIRHDWYQSTTSINFTLLARGVPKDKAVIDITKTSMSISFPVEGTASTYDFTVDPFYGAVDPSKSTHKILPSKIEITLVKATPGTKWHALEGASTTEGDEGTETITPAPASKASGQAPAYPTSARGGPKNWDKIVGEQDSSKDGLDDFDGGDDATKFFKQLYKGASPDTQRAMMKSYQESNGTALSTSWDEVSKQRVETLPPTGMEAKKWSS